MTNGRICARVCDGRVVTGNRECRNYPGQAHVCTKLLYPVPVLINGDEIRQRMRTKGLRRKQVAETLGVSVKAVSNWINGHSEPQGPNLRALERLLGTGPDANAQEQLARSLPTKILFMEAMRRLMSADVPDARPEMRDLPSGEFDPAYLPEVRQPRDTTGL